MRLTIEQTLHRIGRMLSERIAPDVSHEFVAQSARLSGGALNICANWIDDAAELRVEENAAIRAVLGEIAGVAVGDLAARLGEAAASADPGLKLSVLDAENDRLRRLLVEAQGWLEAQDSAAARALNAKVWGLLEEIESKRAPRE
jgi:hypothetical protein